MFAYGIRAPFGSPFILGRFPVSLKPESVHLVGESGVCGAGVVGRGETGYGDW